MSDRPADLRYTKTHEWVRIDGGEATVGITDFAVEHLGDLVFVELPSAGSVVTAGDEVAEVESVKAVSSIYAPVSGEITTVNEPLADDQGPLAGDPYGEGWLFKVKLGGPPPADLLDLPAYELQLEQEGGA